MMMWFLLITVAVAALGGIAAVVALALLLVPKVDETIEKARIEAEVQAAERRLHDIARSSFQAMLEAGRTGSRDRVS